MKIKIILIIGFIVLLIFITGCAQGQEKQVREAIEENRAEIEGAILNVTQQAQLPNCASLKGYICSFDADLKRQMKCGLPFLNTSDSYCCPILCNTCPPTVDCNDNNKCTEDSCILEEAGEPKCIHNDIAPCTNNGICEFGEMNGHFNPYCKGDLLPQISTRQVLSSDCPENCDDGDNVTVDYYDFKAQQCQHKICASIESPQSIQTSFDEKRKSEVGTIASQYLVTSHVNSNKYGSCESSYNNIKESCYKEGGNYWAVIIDTMCLVNTTFHYDSYVVNVDQATLRINNYKEKQEQAPCLS